MIYNLFWYLFGVLTVLGLILFGLCLGEGIVKRKHCDRYPSRVQYKRCMDETRAYIRWKVIP